MNYKKRGPVDGVDYDPMKEPRYAEIATFMRAFNLDMRMNLYELCRIADLGDGPTYISFDVDGLDPVYMPGTGTPEIGGITTLEAQRFLHGLRRLNLIGGDVVEVAPPYEQTGNTALVGASMMFEILCLAADSLASRRFAR